MQYHQLLHILQIAAIYARDSLILPWQDRDLSAIAPSKLGLSKSVTSRLEHPASNLAEPEIFRPENPSLSTPSTGTSGVQLFGYRVEPLDFTPCQWMG